MTIEISDPLDRAREQHDKLRPNSKPQTTFISLNSEFFEAGYGGTAGTGKTFALTTLPLFLRCHEIRGFYGKIWRRSYPQIQESLEPESNKWYPRFGFTYNSTDHVWTREANKAKIAFGFIDKDKDALKHDSAQYHYLGFEELTQFKFNVYIYLLHRCRSDISGWNPICRNAATPGDIGNTWYRDRFVKPAPEGYRTIEGIFRDKITKRIFIRAHKEDNVDLIAQDPGYYDRLEMLGITDPALRKAKLLGDFWAFQGQVFEEFRSFRIPEEPEHAVHVVDPTSFPEAKWLNSKVGFILPEWWPKIIAIDWGYRHGNYVIWGAINPRGQLIIYREQLMHFSPIKEWAANAKYASQFDGNIVKIVIDPMTKGHFGDERSLKEQIEEATGWSIEEADNDRIGGKQLVHELLRWEGKKPSFEQKQGFDQEFAQKLLRHRGLEVYTAYINEYLPETLNEILPKLIIFDTCPALIESVQACVYDEGEGGNRHKAEDVKKQDGDDPYDGLRYLSKYYEKFTQEANSEWTKRCAIAEAVADYKRTSDYMAYSNRMDIIEAGQKVDLSVPKYSRIAKHSRVIVH